jgi:2-amino-4-hydroxy-6-hydroxymethyldihydropteridine diphosphokinase
MENRSGTAQTEVHSIFLSLGSNLGDRLSNLNEAINNLPPQVIPLNVSPVYETPPWGYEKQPPFLNQVIHARTALSPMDLLSYIKMVEIGLGRQPTFRNGPRIIDLDILFYDQLVLDTPPLTIPHPRLSGRAFVLVPLADLDPDLRHPVAGETVQEMLARLDTRDIRPI